MKSCFKTNSNHKNMASNEREEQTDGQEKYKSDNDIIEYHYVFLY